MGGGRAGSGRGGRRGWQGTSGEQGEQGDQPDRGALAAQLPARPRMIAGEPPPMIDGWANPPLAEMAAALPEIERLFEQSGASRRGDTTVSPAELVGLMDAAGIERLLLTSWTRPGRVIVSNDRIAQFIREYPNRFVGLASVDLERPLQAGRELEAAGGKLGFKPFARVP